MERQNSTKKRERNSDQEQNTKAKSFKEEKIKNLLQIEWNQSWLSHLERFNYVLIANFCIQSNQVFHAWFYRSWRHYYALGLRWWFCSCWPGEFDLGIFNLRFWKLKRCETTLFILDTLNYVLCWNFFYKYWMHFC